jgi:hypothetical protein
MKLLRIIATYPWYPAQFYANRPGLADQDFAAQKAALNSDYFAGGNSLSMAMESLGYEVMQIHPGLEPLQRIWAREEGLDVERLGPHDLIIAQAKEFQPDILSYEYYDPKLLERIRNEIGPIKMVLGWEGSALSVGRAWRLMDFILSCAPETVDRLRRAGLRSEIIGHAFDAGINNRLRPTQEPIPVSFIGSIVRRNQFHMERERLLLDLVGQIPLQIFSPSVDVRWQDYMKAAAVGGAYLGVMALRVAKVRKYASKHSRLIRSIERVASVPRLPVNSILSNHSRPGVYGLDFYQVIRDSWVSLNIHADSSPRYASNMRLYEATGVGSCLLTDWKSNLPALFDIDKEIVSYRSSAEALEKARWLLEHPQERDEIARRGQARTLRDYTFGHQARELDSVILGGLANHKAA